jgi:hypothetical protein
MARSQWVGRGSGKVIDLDTGKVYSCSKYAAFDLHLHEKEIVYVCEKYKHITRTGKKLSWYDQFMLENPDSTFPQIREIQRIKVVRAKIPKMYAGNGKIAFDSINWVRLFYRTMSTILVETEGSFHGDIYAILDKFDEVVRRTRPQIKHTTTTALSRHIIINKNLYEKVFNLQVGYVFSKKAKRYVYHFTFEEVENSQKIFDSRFYDYRIDAVGNSRGGKNSSPVVRMSDKMVFASIRRAARLTGINADLIKANCIGDVDVIFSNNITQIFRYAEYED